MQPIYVTVSSSGISNWKLTNWQGQPPMHIGFGIAVSGLSSQYSLQVTMDDPTNVYPSSGGPTVFPASAIGGPVTSSQNQIAAVSSCPIAAWRLVNSSTGGSVTVTALQVGMG
ncbi:hypothetical protein [Bradyrhizobium sp. SZCCHNR1093]|uniref:hypothetical protein n=1 Tax=Bradyrhizobium sp. SZCCHNR1093 TaxID=3057368 RepID=UPI0028EF7DFE|nr:hypothetical protein [Bradyrhizobium sp. SZCCHNR1093]